MKSNCLPKIIIITLSANEIKLSLVRKFVPAFENWRSIVLFRSLLNAPQAPTLRGVVAETMKLGADSSGQDIIVDYHELLV